MKKIILKLNAVVLSLGLAGLPCATFAAETASSSITPSGQPLPSLAPMLQMVMPSVVSINVEGTTQATINQNPFADLTPFCQQGSPFLDSPFCSGSGLGRKQTEKFSALGSGVIINADKGYVVTNNHVVDNATKIQVQLNDGRRFAATVIGKDPRSDIALIQLKNPKNLRSIKIADSNRLQVGDYTVAIGNPYGLGETVTSGIVSALGRSGLNLENYENFIQTDAAINRGNSGGALVNLRGELIGINTAILAPDGGNIGIGFAIPSNMVTNLTKQIIEYGQVKRGELGILGKELNPEIAKALNVDAQRGAVISQVMPDSAAMKAGLKPGDVIVSLNGKPLTSFAELRAEAASLPIGTNLDLGIIRDSKPMNFRVALQQSVQNKTQASTLSVGLDGAELSNYNKDNVKGVQIDNVKPRSTAEQIGLRKGDVILGVNQKKVTNLGELRKILEAKPELLALNIKRGSTSVYLFAK